MQLGFLPTHFLHAPTDGTNGTSQLCFLCAPLDSVHTYTDSPVDPVHLLHALHSPSQCTGVLAKGGQHKAIVGLDLRGAMSKSQFNLFSRLYP